MQLGVAGSLSLEVLSGSDYGNIFVFTGNDKKIVDIIYLHGLKVDCVIGVWEWEKQITQSITVDLDMGFNIAPAAASDQLQDTLSYRDVSKRVEAFIRQSRFGLVEKLAEQVAAILTDEFNIKWCRVKINKFGAVRGAGDVGVIIERGQKE